MERLPKIGGFQYDYFATVQFHSAPNIIKCLKKPTSQNEIVSLGLGIVGHLRLGENDPMLKFLARILGTPICRSSVSGKKKQKRLKINAKCWIQNQDEIF